MAKKIRFVKVSPPIEMAVDWRAVHPEDADHVFSTRFVFDEAVNALRDVHPGIPDFCENDLDWREWVEDLLDTHPLYRDAEWEKKHQAAMDADKAIKAWVHERYEKPELVCLGTVGETDWKPLTAQPWVKRAG